MTMKVATLFTGIGGADAGFREAGLDHLWGIELDPKMSAIAELNGFEVFTGDVVGAPYKDMKRPDWLHASPPCQNASVINSKGKESSQDELLAASICQAITTLNPDIFSLENVQGYVSFHSFHNILKQLKSNGYHALWCVLDAADYGVPQNRLRLFLIASKLPDVTLPEPTHTQNPDQLPLFGRRLEPVVSWDKAIAHLPEPPVHQLSEKMAAMVRRSITARTLVNGFKNRNFPRALSYRGSGAPSATIIRSCNRPSNVPHILSPDDEPRMLLPVHYSALQGFPEWYELPNKTQSDRANSYKGVGNAVPPLMMEAIARKALNCINQHSQKKVA